jgi:hypothetical protein
MCGKVKSPTLAKPARIGHPQNVSQGGIKHIDYEEDGQLVTGGFGTGGPVSSGPAPFEMTGVVSGSV